MSDDLTAQIDAAVAEATAPLKDSIAKLEAKRDELIEEKKRATARAETAESAVAEAEKKAGAFEARTAAAEGRVFDLVVEQGLTEQLTTGEARVVPEMVRAVKALIKAEHAVELKDGAALIDGAPMAEFVTGWKASDTGRVYLAAPVSSGGGAPPAAPSAQAAQPNPWARESFNLTEQGRLLREDPDLATRLQKKATG